MKGGNGGRGDKLKGVAVVKSGDSWESIAKKMFGDERMFEELMRANPNINMLRPGQTLRLPYKVSNPYVSNYTAAAQGMATTDQFDAAGNATVKTGAPILPGGTNTYNAGRRGAGVTSGATTSAGLPGVPRPNSADRTKDDTSTAANRYGTPVMQVSGVGSQLPYKPGEYETPIKPALPNPSNIPVLPSTMAGQVPQRSQGEQIAARNQSAQAWAAQNMTAQPSVNGQGGFPNIAGAVSGAYNALADRMQANAAKVYSSYNPTATAGGATGNVPQGPTLPQTPSQAQQAQVNAQVSASVDGIKAAMVPDGSGSYRFDPTKAPPVIEANVVDAIAQQSGASNADIINSFTKRGYVYDSVNNALVLPSQQAQQYGGAVPDLFAGAPLTQVAAGGLPAYRPPVYKNGVQPIRYKRTRSGGTQYQGTATTTKPAASDGGASGGQSQKNATWRIGG